MISLAASWILRSLPPGAGAYLPFLKGRGERKERDTGEVEVDENSKLSAGPKCRVDGAAYPSQFLVSGVEKIR